MNQEPVTSLKGIGEKTAGLFARLGVHTVEDLLHKFEEASGEEFANDRMMLTK